MSSILFERRLTREQTHVQYASVFRELQGYVFVSHGRSHVWLGLVRFRGDEEEALAGDDLANARRLLARLGKEASTAAELRKSFEAYSDAKKVDDSNAKEAAKAPLVRAVGLSSAGYRKLGLITDLFDTPFREGFVNRPALKGRIADIYKVFHAIVVVAGEEIGKVAQAAAEVEQSFGNLAKVDFEKGHTEQKKKTDVVREPFGFAENISQPVFFAEDMPGTVTAKWSPAAQANVVLAPELSAANGQEFGSYMAFLKIEQHKPKFDKLVANTAAALSKGAVAVPVADVESSLVGRSKDGAPLIEGGSNQNDFDFTGDPKGELCPFSAHIRKVNPREENTHVILRRGITFQDEKTGSRGTLFQCFQSSLSNGFEHIYQHWALDPDHPRRGAGLDAILATELTTILYGEYFYFPSIPFFTRLENPKFNGLPG